MAKSNPRKKVPKLFGLPEPEEVNKIAEALAEKKVIDKTVEIIDGQEVIEHKKKNRIGRPPATHNRKRTSVMVDPILWQRIKLIALKKNMEISDILEMGIHAVLKKYKDVL
jgi:hypothetical protein